MVIYGTACNYFSLLMAKAAIPVMDLDYMRDRFAGNDASCNPGLQSANLISLISALLFSAPKIELH